MDGGSPLDELHKALSEGNLDAARAAADALKESGLRETQLAAEVLHELRQPLLGIKAYAQMLAEGNGGKKMLSVLLAQAERMEQIIGDFTRLATNKPAPKEKVNLAHHIRQAANLFSMSADSSRVNLEIEAPTDVEILGNGRLLEQLTLNLLNNARDAMSGLGRIKVRLTREQGGAVMAVADWGPGIAPEMRDKIFEPYVTSKAKGSGLGLAVCRRIAQDHGAQIALAPSTLFHESPPPATVVRIIFPSQQEAASTARKRILVVDDESIIRAVFADLLQRDYEVIEAETAEQALEQLDRGTYDLIITDKNLPGLSGLDLAQEARKRNSASKVILMTGYPSLVTAQQALDLGVLDYLLKPFDDIKEVRDKIRTVLNAPLPTANRSATGKRVDVYEDNPASARQISDALTMIGLDANIVTEAHAAGDNPPAGVIVSWTFGPAPGRKGVELAKGVSRGALFVVLAENLTMETALESLRGGAAACLPKLLSDTKAMSREIQRALRLTPK